MQLSQMLSDEFSAHLLRFVFGSPVLTLVHVYVHTYAPCTPYNLCTVKLASYIHTSKGTQNQYLLSEVLTTRVGLCT